MIPFVSVGAVVKVTKGLSPTALAPPTVKASVEPTALVPRLAILSVAEPSPLLPGFTRMTPVPATRFSVPMEAVPFVPLRLMNSNAPPSRLTGVEVLSRFVIVCTPESFQLKSALVTVMALVLERRPWSISERMLPWTLVVP